MARRKNDTGEKQDKKMPIKIRPIARKHAGIITEPYAIMERLIGECEFFKHLKVAKIKLWWQKDWKADVDGIATGAMICKATEIDRNLSEESGGETVDLFIKLPESQWPTLDETEKEHRLFHELLHIMPSNNANGNQKTDSKDRLIWRLRKHPIPAFYEEIDRYGNERVIGHNNKIIESIAHADRPMEKIFDDAEKTTKPTGKKDWRKIKIDQIGLKDSDARKLIDSGILTAGELQDEMRENGTWWNRKIKGIGDAAKERIEDIFNKFVIDNDTDTETQAA